MNIKKEVFKSIQSKLRKEQSSLRHKITLNKYDMKRLTDEQTRNKRELAELEKIIKNLDN